MYLSEIHQSYRTTQTKKNPVSSIPPVREPAMIRYATLHLSCRAGKTSQLTSPLLAVLCRAMPCRAVKVLIFATRSCVRGERVKGAGSAPYNMRSSGVLTYFLTSLLSYRTVLGK